MSRKISPDAYHPVNLDNASQSENPNLDSQAEDKHGSDQDGHVKTSRRKWVLSGATAALAAAAGLVYSRKPSQDGVIKSPNNIVSEQKDIYSSQLSVYEPETNIEVKSHAEIDPIVQEYLKNTIKTFVTAHCSVVKPEVKINLHVVGNPHQTETRKVSNRVYNTPQVKTMVGIKGDQAVLSVAEITIVFDAADFETPKTKDDIEKQKQVIFSYFAKYFLMLGSRIESVTQNGKTENNEKKRVVSTKVLQLLFPKNVADVELLKALGLENELEKMPFAIKYVPDLGFDPLGQEQQKSSERAATELNQQTMQMLTEATYELCVAIGSKLHFNKDYVEKLSKISDITLRNKAMDAVGSVIDLFEAYISNIDERKKIMREIVQDYDKNSSLLNLRTVILTNEK